MANEPELIGLIVLAWALFCAAGLFGQVVGGADGYSSPHLRLIVRRKWTPPVWLKAGWIAQEQNGEWYWHADEPQIVDGEWENDVAFRHLCQDAFDFVPPPCADWKQSKRRIN